MISFSHSHPSVNSVHLFACQFGSIFFFIVTLYFAADSVRFSRIVLFIVTTRGQCSLSAHGYRYICDKLNEFRSNCSCYRVVCKISRAVCWCCHFKRSRYRRCQIRRICLFLVQSETWVICVVTKTTHTHTQFVCLSLNRNCSIRLELLPKIIHTLCVFLSLFSLGTLVNICSFVLHELRHESMHIFVTFQTMSKQTRKCQSIFFFGGVEASTFFRQSLMTKNCSLISKIVILIWE